MFYALLILAILSSCSTEKLDTDIISEETQIISEVNQTETVETTEYLASILKQ